MLAVLEQARALGLDQSPEALVFPATEKAGGKPIDNSGIGRWIRSSLKEPKITAHGFRSTLKDWCRANRFPMDWYEIQADHALGNRTSRSYGPDKLIEERRGMMELWGEYCSKPAPEPQAGVVVNLSEKRRPA